MSDNETDFIKPVTLTSLSLKRIERLDAEITALNRSVDSIVAVNARLEDELAKHIGGGKHSDSPTVRVRMSFSPPTKDRGWNCEQTVEVDGMTTVDWDDIARKCEDAYDVAESECMRRDKADGRERKHFA